MLRSIQRAQALFIDSEYCRNQIARHLPHQAHKFIVAPCGIKQPGPPGAKPPSWATPSDRPFFLYVGSFSDNKNQRTLLAAWHLFQTKYPDAPRLVLIGPGRGQYMDEVIHPLHRALPRPEEVILPGFTAEEDLNWAFWNATAYLQPSIAEGFGLPVIEAMSCGLPVACSDSTSLPEVAGGNALLFNPHSPNSILEAIEKLWQDQALRAQMAEAGRIHATRYTWEKNAKIVADAIHSQLTKTRNE
ncbi:MAG: glycosyltransferase family 4 protein [Kiritimatiellae bacterium]|nr:glycosyltransferase family 4 protein [Kiritimatiellia bacterium]